MRFRRFLYLLAGGIAGLALSRLVRHGLHPLAAIAIAFALFMCLELCSLLWLEIRLGFTIFAERNTRQCGATYRLASLFLRRDERLERLLGEVNARAVELGFTSVSVGIRWRRRWLYPIGYGACADIAGHQGSPLNLVSVNERTLGGASDEQLRVVIAHELGHCHIRFKTPHPFLRRLSRTPEETACNLFAGYLYSVEAVQRSLMVCNLELHGVTVKRFDLTRPYRPPGVKH